MPKLSWRANRKTNFENAISTRSKQFYSNNFKRFEKVQVHRKPISSKITCNKVWKNQWDFEAKTKTQFNIAFQILVQILQEKSFFYSIASENKQSWYLSFWSPPCCHPGNPIATLLSLRCSQLPAGINIDCFITSFVFLAPQFEYQRHHNC